jgi:hypothetical protein
MAQLGDIDTSTAGELSEGFQAFPPGDYPLYLESSERKTTKKGDGEYLECVFVVADGEHKSKKVFHRFNLWNPNQTAVDIAKSQWRALCEVTVGQPNAPGNDSASLNYKIFWAAVNNVPMNKDDPNSKRSNEIVFRKGKLRAAGAGGGAPAPIASAPPPQQNTQAAAVAQGTAAPAVVPGSGGRPPWAKK